MNSALALPISRPPLWLSRNLLVVCAVLFIHIVVLWAMQSGLLRRVIEVVVPAEILTEFVDPPRPKVVPPPLKPSAVKIAAPVQSAAKLPPPPQLMAVKEAEPSPHAPTGVTSPPAPLPPITAPVATQVAPPPASPATPPPAKVELPSSDADYLQNPRPAYPPMSRRMGEQGKVLIRVLIGPDGTAQKTEIKQTSGFERLDQAAMNTVQKWRYVPGKRGGVAEAMWFVVPINFVLE